MIREKTAWLLMPVFDDWVALSALLSEIHRLETPWLFRVLLINDHPLPPPSDWLTLTEGKGRLHDVSVLRLRRNVGHQRAIALGLCHWLGKGEAGPIVVMDADGEDQPNDIPRLLAAGETAEWGQVVFAARQKRSESLVFRTGYQIYRQIHYLLTGMKVRFGNFSALSRAQVESLVHQSDLWNHYANAVLRSRLPYDSIPTARGRRYAGQSRLNLAGWVAHGLSALAMFSDVAGTRVLLASMAGLVFSFALVLGAGAYAAWSGIVAAHWIVLVALVLMAIFSQASAATLLFLFMVLGNRTAASFIPIRDGTVLIGDELPVWREAVADRP